jgi:hypothetical protein
MLSASVIHLNCNNVWVDDNMVTHCHHCRAQFWSLLRKHHCRNCGNIFCHNCTSHNIVIPKFITDRPEPADYWNISYYIYPSKPIEERVCDACFQLIQYKKQSYSVLTTIMENPPNIDYITKTPDYDQQIKSHYYDHLRNIQYYLPDHVYNITDIKLINVNSHLFSKHSKYLVHLLKITIWNDKSLANIIAIINHDQIHTCEKMFCTRTCQEQLSCDDCVNILYSCKSDKNRLPGKIVSFLFQIINASPDQVILCHLLFFCTLLAETSNNDILEKVSELLSRSTRIIYQTYWILRNSLAMVKSINNTHYFLRLIETELLTKMSLEYTFFSGIIENLDKVRPYLEKYFVDNGPICLPYQPDVQLISVDLDSIIIKNSCTRPTIITFTGSNGKEIRLLFKRESIINDMTVLNLMTLCDIILKENLSDNFDVIVYPAIQLTNQGGMIEIVQNAETVYAISRTESILQYIIRKNNDRVIGDVLDRYMFSLVAYTLHNYFIGLGDRHLQNIMITDDGAIFHIDFGFIMGQDAHSLTTNTVKINANMIDAIGGSEGERYRKYLDLCASGVVILRKYHNMFHILLSQNPDVDTNVVSKFVLSRFQPRQTDNVLIEELISVIRQSNEAYSHYIMDFLHYHTQEKTVQTGLVNIFQQALGALNFTYY